MKNVVPDKARAGLRRVVMRPPLGRVDMGELRRLRPVSRRWGFDRGGPVDRYYVERFLGKHREEIRGAVLEIGDSRYVTQFGDLEAAVDSIDVLHFAEGNPKATIVGDLTHAPQIESGRFDCVICTQTLQFVPDPWKAMETLHRILKPGGTLLLTVPCISQLDTDPENSWHDRWRFTTRAVHDLAGGCGAEGDDREVEAWGNILSATAFLQGIAARELTEEELHYRDSMFEVLVTLRVRKDGNAPSEGRRME